MLYQERSLAYLVDDEFDAVEKTTLEDVYELLNRGGIVVEDLQESLLLSVISVEILAPYHLELQDRRLVQRLKPLLFLAHGVHLLVALLQLIHELAQEHWRLSAGRNIRQSPSPPLPYLDSRRSSPTRTTSSRKSKGSTTRDDIKK